MPLTHWQVFFNGMGNSVNASQRNVGVNGTTISIGNITLPEVKDGKSFVDYLQNFAVDITQRAYAH